MDWWLTQVGGVPVGPASTELVLKGIEAGKVPMNTLVCEVGGSRWKSLRDVPDFARALRTGKHSRFDPKGERTVLDPEFFPTSRPPPPRRFDSVPVSRYDDGSDRTVAERPKEPARQDERRQLHEVDEEDEKTIVDTFPPIPSEPPRR
jgi:hypothetical protein